jgi:hypothetical protein
MGIIRPVNWISLAKAGGRINKIEMTHDRKTTLPAADAGM